MFSVYGVTGRVFTGTVEQLRHIDQVHAVARLHRIEANELEILPELAQEEEGLGTNTQTHKPLPNPALAAYTQVAQPDTPRQPLTRVAQLMTQPAITLQADTLLFEAADVLARKKIGQAPVLDANGQLVGMLLRADLYRTDLAPNASGPPSAPDYWATRMAQPISSAMWTPIASVSAETDIRRVARVLLDTELPGLPVVDDAGKVIGFVSRADILRAVATDPPLDVWG
jgi:CBS-domain-containing membrane protein